MFWLIIILYSFIGILLLAKFGMYMEKRKWTATVKEYEIEWPIDSEWKFTKADLILAMKNSVNGYLQGKCFFAYNIPGLKCDLRIFPNGYVNENRGQTWIFLYVKASKERKIASELTFSIESASFSDSVNKVYEKYEGHGTNICKTGKFFDRKNKYFMDEEITVKVKGILKAKRPTVSKIAVPISLKWKIKEDDLKEALKPESDGRLISKVLNIPSLYDTHYWLEMHTQLFDDESRAKTCLYLYVGFGDEKKIEAVVEFSVDSVDYHRTFEQIYESYRGYGICLTEDIFDPSKRYIVDGYLTVHLTAIFMVKKNRRMTMKSKNGLLQNQDAKDFMIVIGEQQIQVHKQLLMDVSPVWAAMFGSGMKESAENKMVIKDFPFKIVAAAVQIFYNQNGFSSLTMEEMFLLYRFGNKYFIEFLLDLVEHALIKMISPSNVCHLIHLSAPECYNIHKLHESCIKFMNKCFKESTPVYGAEGLGKKFLVSILLRGFHPDSDTVTQI